MRIRFRQSVSGQNFSAAPGTERTYGVNEATPASRAAALAEAKSLVEAGQAEEVCDVQAEIEALKAEAVATRKAVEALGDTISQLLKAIEEPEPTKKK